MLRACAIEFGGSWDVHLPLAEFSYNNSYHASIGMPPYEMLYGRKCRTPICWGEIGEKEVGGSDLVLKTNEKIEIIRERLKAAQDRQKSYADRGRRSIEFKEERVGEVAYRLELPEKLSGIHNTFHVSHLRKCLTAQSTIVPLDEVDVNEKLGYIEESVDIVDEQVRKIRN
ncbi:uncharacterized protein [Rutidosis leptorrhynchoides]|uniref:uncharacterized protein n=1 Tax=Rutidosis leptorrhynchoides TaxID=125765 RepID=UPI003A991EBE